MKRARWMALGLVIMVCFLSGCGRFRPPGTTPFSGNIPRTSTGTPADSPIPKQPWFEVGPANAKVRILAFYPMDKARQPVMDLLKSLAKQYPGKVYVKYMDIRAPEGQAAMSRSGVTTPGLLINGENSVTINAKPNPYTVDFNQDIGVFWTPEYLKAAVAQELAKPKK